MHVFHCSHPIDVVKTRLQVSGDGSAGSRNYKALGVTGTISSIIKEEGATAFWNGISAAWLREASYTSLRLGMYAPIKQGLGVTNDSNFFMKFFAGSAAGALGSAAGNPFDVLKTRMMANSAKNAGGIVEIATILYRKQGIVTLLYKNSKSLTKLTNFSLHNHLFRRGWFLPWSGRQHYACDGAEWYADELLRPNQVCHRQVWLNSQRWGPQLVIVIINMICTCKPLDYY